MKRGLKIGIILDTSLDPPDGVQQYVISIGEWLRTHGHDVHYIVGETTRTDLPNIHSLARNFSIRFNGNRTTIPLPTSRKKLRDFLAAQRFDILHVQSPHNPFLAQRLIMAADKTVPIVATFHVLPEGKMPAYATAALGVWLRPSLKRINRMLPVSPAARLFMKKTFRVDGAVSPNVFDYSLFHHAKPLDAYDDDRLTILFLGRLVPRKGCRYLLEAITKIDRANVPKFRVVVCGKGALRTELEKYTQEHHIDDLVEFAGFVSEEDKPRYYASADIAVFQSTGGESFGIVLIEAMASGKAAVLAGNNPGYSSVMESQPDQLFAPKQTDELAERLTMLLQNDAKRHAYAEWGSVYSRRFDVEVVGPEVVAIYQELLRQRNVQ